MKYVSILLLCILAAVCYGIIHDQITARICIEYFTVGHADVFGTRDPTRLGLGWGIIATWWVGLLLGVPLAFAAQYGSRPKRSAASLIRPITSLLGITGCFAALSGAVGFVAATVQMIYLSEPLASQLPSSRHIAFLTDLWIHLGSYGSSFVGGIILCWKTWQSRQVPVD